MSSYCLLPCAKAEPHASNTCSSNSTAQSSTLNVLDPLWMLGSGHGGSAVLQLGHSRGPEQQCASEELQAVGEPGQTQRPPEGGVNIGQTLRPHQPLCLSLRLVRVEDVEAHTTQRQQTCRDTLHTHTQEKRLKSVLGFMCSLSWSSVH